MTWSDEVHNSRCQAALGRATAERKLRKRGLPVPVMETAQVGPVMAMVALASGLTVWQLWGAQLRAALATNPLVQQFRTLVFGSNSSATRQVSSKVSGKGSSGSKVSARKPGVAVPTPGQAAAAAAEARILATSPQAASSRLVPPIPSRPAQTDPQPQASTSTAAPEPSEQHTSQPSRTGSATAGTSGAASGSSSGGSKKKGKKRR